MWKLSIEDDQGQKTVVNLVRDVYSIGRAEDNSIRLTERNISRHHARIVHAEHAWFLEDNHSYNGAYVNGVRVAGRQELAHGDLVQLGDYRVELIDEDLDTREQGHRRISTIPELPNRETLTTQPDRLVMLIGPDQGSEFPINVERTMIGRGEECDLCINHASVSRVHAEIRRVGEGRYEIVDKGSANGVRINGVELDRALLDARDVIELGDVVLKFIQRGQIFIAGTTDSQKLAALTGPSQTLPPEAASKGSKKMVIAAGATLVVGAAAIVGLSKPDAGGPIVTEHALQEAPASPAESKEARALSQATALLEDGDVFGAHDALSEIPRSHPVAKSKDFRSVESEWADAMLQAALDELDKTKRREILSEVAAAPTVDAERRAMATAAIEELAPEAVDVGSLQPAAPAPSAHRAEASRPPPAKVQLKEEPGTGPESPLVRANPFGPSPVELATSGDPAKVAKAKALLQKKADQGLASATEQKLLRALCRQLGDVTCSQ